MAGLRSNRQPGRGTKFSVKSSISYYSNQNIDSVKRPKTVKSYVDIVGRRVRWFLSWAVALSLSAGLIYFGFTLSGKAKVVSATDPYRSATDLQTMVDRYTQSIKSRSKLTFDPDRLVNSIKSQFPEVDSVDVEVPLLGRTPIVRVGIAKPSAIFINTNSKSYIMASTGKLVAQKSQLDASSALPTLQDHSRMAADIGSQILSRSQLEFIKVVDTQVKKAGYKVDHYSLPNKPQELDLYLKGREFYVKMVLNGDSVRQSGAIVASLHYISKKRILPRQYVDVRVSGRIFYR